MQHYTGAGGLGGSAAGSTPMPPPMPQQQQMRPRGAQATHEPAHGGGGKGKGSLWKGLAAVLLVCLFAYGIIYAWIESQHGAFEFLGVEPSREEYQRRIIAFYEEHNPEKLEGDRHRRPVDSILWKYRGRERQLLEKLHKKYANKPKPAESSEAQESAGAEDSAAAGGEKSKRDL